MTELRRNECGGYLCRPNCGACCIAPSIASALPGLPQGKPAGVACPHLDSEYRCRLFGKPERPACCADLKPHPSMCGRHREEALQHLEWLEQVTSRDSS